MRLWLLFAVSSLFACTDFLVQTGDGAYINGRSLEFGMDLQAKIKLFPRNQKMISQAPDRKKGVSWTSKYGYLGVIGMGKNFSFDGMNEEGLSFGYLWLPGVTEYPVLGGDEMRRGLDFIDLGAWALGQFSSVAEVKMGLKNVAIWAHPVPPLPGTPPVHAAFHDREGNSLVIEFVGGKMKVYDNPIGILTNSPPFDWQMINLSNYLHLNALNAEAITQSGVTLVPPGEGSGLLGMPGDWSPPSRFVKVATFLRFVEEAETADSGINLAEHLLNSVDIPLGAIRDGNGSRDFTQWAVIKDLTRRVFYFRSYKDLTLKKIDLRKCNLDMASSSLSIDAKAGYFNVTDSFTNCTQR